MKQKINKEFIQKWSPIYDASESDEKEYADLIETVSSELSSKGVISRKTFERIMLWKDPRRFIYGKIKWDDYDMYESTLKRCFLAPNSDKMDILVSLYGIGLPFGSTILHFAYPNSFPIIDIRTVRSLNDFELIDFKRTPHKYDVHKYYEFRKVMLEIKASISGTSLRQIDRALFAFDKFRLNPKQISNQSKTANQRIHTTHVDVKIQMAELLIHHNLLHGRKWGEFHKDINAIVQKYHPLYMKGLDDWMEQGKINNNV